MSRWVGTGLGLCLLLFGWETLLSHGLALLGWAWDSPLEVATWLRHAGLACLLGPLVGAVGGLLAWLAERCRSWVESLRKLPGQILPPRAQHWRAVAWAALLSYGLALLVPRLDPWLSPAGLVLLALGGLVFAVGHLALVPGSGGPWHRGLDAMLFGSLLAIPTLALVHVRALAGSALLPRNLGWSLAIGVAGPGLVWGGMVLQERFPPVLRSRWRGVRWGLILLLLLLYLALAGLVAQRGEGGEGGEMATGTSAGRPLERGSAPPDLLLILIDTLRADRLGSYGGSPARTPHLDALAARGIRYDRHLSSSPWTYPAVGTLLTGRSPTSHGAVLIREVLGEAIERGRLGAQPLRSDLPTLGTLLSEAGYETALIASNPYLTGVFGFERGFTTYEVVLRSTVRYTGLTLLLAGLGWRPLEPSDPTLSADEMTDRFMAWWQRARGRPKALIAHYMDPHFPYDPPERHRRGLGEPPIARERPIERLAAFYAGEVAFVDEQVGRLLHALGQAGRLENTVIAVTSDHGETFLDHGSWVSWEEMPDGPDPFASRGVDHGQSLYQELLHVPWIVAGPGISPAVDERLSRGVDVLPTLLTLLGVPMPPGIEGEVRLPGWPVSARGALSEALLSGREKKSWCDGAYKLIWNPPLAGPAKIELYDLLKDPKELADRSRAEPERAAALEAELWKTLGSLERGSRAGAVGLDPGLEAKLKALGYLQ